MPYDFDRIIDRYNTDSLKYDFAEKRGRPADILPLWVADMDFQAPDEVIEALVEKSRHGIFGYSEGLEDYDEAVFSWFRTYFGWEVKRPWLVKTPGVVYAVTTAIRAYTKKEDAILIQEPVYYPFRESIEINDRRIVVNQLVYENHKYHIDFEDFERKIVDENIRLFILCSPHNPVGRVWRKEELVRMAEICLKHNVLIVSDEIHMDFTYDGYKHEVLANLDERYNDFVITCTAPSKTFNLAALQLSNVFIPNRELRQAFKDAMARSGYSQPNVMGLVSTKAAYTYGRQWLEELKVYLKGNLEYMKDYLAANVPEAIVVEPEGTYLVWVDVSCIPRFSGKTPEEIDTFMVERAGLWLDGGTMFGEGGEGFQRFNIACPRQVLKKALDQFSNALK